MVVRLVVSSLSPPHHLHKKKKKKKKSMKREQRPMRKDDPPRPPRPPFHHRRRPKQPIDTSNKRAHYNTLQCNTIQHHTVPKPYQHFNNNHYNQINCENGNIQDRAKTDWGNAFPAKLLQNLYGCQPNSEPIR